MINIYISKKDGKYSGTNDTYPEIKTIKPSYKECHDYMIEKIVNRQNTELELVSKKTVKPKLGFAA